MEINKKVLIHLTSGGTMNMTIYDPEATVLGEISKLLENRAKGIIEGAIVDDPILAWEEINGE